MKYCITPDEPSLVKRWTRIPSLIVATNQNAPYWLVLNKPDISINYLHKLSPSLNNNQYLFKFGIAAVLVVLSQS
jgi:hypothetical protein